MCTYNKTPFKSKLGIKYMPTAKATEPVSAKVAAQNTAYTKNTLDFADALTRLATNANFTLFFNLRYTLPNCLIIGNRSTTRNANTMSIHTAELNK
jgi:hypothetical protein